VSWAITIVNLETVNLEANWLKMSMKRSLVTIATWRMVWMIVFRWRTILIEALL
jgi:hypothetical protein